MSRPEIVEMPNFKYTSQDFNELKAMLKDGNVVRNPFARYYAEKVEVTVINDAETEQPNN